jgi:hypothetical protein
VRFRRDVGRLQPDLTHGVSHLGTTGNRDDIGQRVQVAIPLQLPFDGRQQILKTNTGQKHHDADFPHQQPVAEIRRSRGFGDRHLAQGRCDERRARKPFDESRDFVSSPAFKRGHAQPVKTGGGLAHSSYLRFAHRGYQGGPCRPRPFEIREPLSGIKPVRTSDGRGPGSRNA